MSSDPKPDPKDATSAAPADRQRLPYEPPAISWEELFEPLAATSCSLVPIQGGPCSVKPST